MVETLKTRFQTWLIPSLIGLVLAFITVSNTRGRTEAITTTKVEVVNEKIKILKEDIEKNIDRIEDEVDKKAYQSEVDRIYTTLDRIEGKLDLAIQNK